MGYAIIALVVGIIFILAGRWVYANPRKLFEGSLYTPRGGPFMRFWIRLFGVMLIFGGAFTLVAEPASLVVHNTRLVTLLGTIAAVLAAVFLRPRPAAEERAISELPSRTMAQRGGPLTLKGKLFVATMVVGGLAVSAEAILLPQIGRGGLWPDVALVTILIVASGLLVEALLL